MCKMGSLQIQVFVMLLLCVGVVQAQFKCYACVYNDNPSREGYTCVTAPQNISHIENEVECELYKICHVEKTIAVFNGEILHLIRGCGERTEGCSSDEYEEECTTVCNDKSLCNDQNQAPTSTTAPPGSSTTTKDPNAQLNCYYCQYDIDADDDISRGPYECVTSPWNITGEANTVRCPAQGYSCYVMQTRNRESKHVKTMGRACRETENTEDLCSPLVGTSDEACLQQCEEDLCNSQTWETGGASVVLPHNSGLICLIVWIVRIYWN